jgi:hypothetical protein
LNFSVSELQVIDFIVVAGKNQLVVNECHSGQIQVCSKMYAINHFKTAPKHFFAFHRLTLFIIFRRHCFRLRPGSRRIDEGRQEDERDRPLQLDRIGRMERKSFSLRR